MLRLPFAGTIVTTIAVAASPVPLVAQDFNVDVGDPALGVPSSTYGAAAGRPGTWNAFDLTGPMQLSDLTGALSGVTLETTGGVLYDFDNGGTSGDHDALLDDMQDVGYEPAFVDWTITGLSSGVYDIYTYAFAPDHPWYTTKVSVVGSTDGPQYVSGSWGGGHSHGVTFARHRVVVDGGGSVQVRVDSEFVAGSVNGFQIALVEDLSVGENYCTSTANSTGSPAVIWGTGSDSVASEDLVLHAGPMPNQPGLFFYGPNQVQVAFGNGFRCVGGQLFRLDIVVAANGELTFAPDYDNPPSQAGQILPGVTFHFQAWYRDPNGGGASFNLSDGLTITFTQ